MKVFLLAAGQSKRVKPIEDKNFIRLCGKFLIEHQMEALIKAGFKDLVIIGGKHNLQRLKDCAEEFAKKKGISCEVVEQKKLKEGMAGAILSAKSKIKTNEPVLIVSSNDVVDASAYELISKAIQKSSADSFLLAKRVKEYFPGGYLKVDSKGKIQHIVEKPGAGKEPSDLVNLVVHGHKNTKALYQALESVKTGRDDRYEVTLDAMIQKGMTLQSIPYEGYWQPIKYPWHIFEVAHHFFKNLTKGISKKAILEKRITVKGEVVIEEGVKVFDGATLIGPLYIGKGSVIATNALVRESFLGERCVIGYNTEVARSILGDDVWTHSNYIGDSLIGNDVSFGAGTITGNLRFDEKNIGVTVESEKQDSGRNKLGIIAGDRIRVGINTSFLPGIKIGCDSLVGPGLVVDRDVEEGTFVTGKMELRVTPNKNRGQHASRKDMLSKLSTKK